MEDKQGNDALKWRWCNNRKKIIIYGEKMNEKIRNSCKYNNVKKRKKKKKRLILGKDEWKYYIKNENDTTKGGKYL